MLFNSIHYLVFLPVVTAIYLSLPLRIRRVFLLACGFYFYGVFSWKLSLLMVWSTLQDYYAARIIERSTRPSVRRAALAASIIGNLSILGTFKYLDFINHSIADALGWHPWPILNLVLPLGISFYTFEAMSYVIDVYRGDLKACDSMLDYGLFITFFPHLVAGPIMRARDMLPQFHEMHEPNGERMLSGALLCIWGLLKKVLVADPMGRMVESVYGTIAAPISPGEFSSSALLLATYAFALQIYCDFSAYSDIAIGSARMMGLRIMQNFDAPYLAISIRDFWRRWHISLSTWLRDYLYIPLGGSRISEPRTYLNLIVTMLLGGLWHGANWTFVVWGGLHGLYLAVERVLGVDTLDRARMGMLEKWLRGVLTFHLVCLAWVFFRAPTAAYAFELIWRVVTLADGAAISYAPLVGVLLLVAVQIAKRRVDFGAIALRYPNMSRWAAYACIVVLVRAIATSPSVEFIYFQF